MVLTVENGACSYADSLGSTSNHFMILTLHFRNWNPWFLLICKNIQDILCLGGLCMGQRGIRKKSSMDIPTPRMYRRNMDFYFKKRICISFNILLGFFYFDIRCSFYWIIIKSLPVLMQMEIYWIGKGGLQNHIICICLL